MIVGLLGGTFDPPHGGHLELARLALASGLVQAVWLVPCARHALGKRPAPFRDRVAMCRLLVRGHPAIEVSEVEAEIGGPGHTLDLVRTLVDRHPDHSFRLIAGADVWHERDKWYRFEEVARLAPFVWAARRGVLPVPGSCLEAPPEVSSSGIRAALARGERPANVPETVLEYIAAHGLYREDS